MEWMHCIACVRWTEQLLNAIMEASTKQTQCPYVQKSCHCVVLRLLQILLQWRWRWKKVDVIASYSAGDDKPAKMLQRWHRVEPRHWVQQLNWRWCQSRSTGTKKVKKLSTPRVRHRTLHELHNRCSTVWLWLGIEAELSCVPVNRQHSFYCSAALLLRIT